MKNRKFLILPIIVAIVVLLCVGAVILGKNDNSQETKADELIYDDNGNVYKNVSTDGYEIRVNINQQSIIEQKPLFNGDTVNISYYDMCGKNNGRYYMDTIYEMPELFDTENVAQVTYTLQNAVGKCILRPRKTYRTQQDPYKQKVIVENNPVTWKAGDKEAMCLQIYVNATEDKNSEWYPVSKEELENAIIKSDIEYIDGTKETRYFGMKVSNPYNCTNLYFFELLMQ